jgi:hypothetical protein
MFVPKKSSKNHPKSPGSPTRAQKTYRPMPTQEQIRGRAYELYVAGGSVKGQDQQDWFRAEKEMFAQ